MAPDSRFLGRFQILDRIAQGGMGALYRAHDPMLDREVAIKVLRDDFDNDELRQRFSREAQSAARLRHPNIVTIFDVGEHEGKPFIAMEYIQGVTLAEIVRQAATTPIARKLELMDELASALAYAHKRGIVHRDIKPANLMVDADGTLKVLDFGIARIAESGLTQAGMMMGTLNYMSPEQLGGGVIDARSDIFAVGAVYYELLSGRQAFPGGIDTGILNRILNSATAELESVCPGIDPALADIVKRCLDKDPERRYQDLGATRRDIAAVRRRLDSPEDAPPARANDAETIGGIPTPAPLRTAGRGATNRTDLQRRRREQIDSHIEEARRQMAADSYQGVVAACEQALLLDPDNATALSLLDRAREALDRRQAEEWLRDAEDQIARGATSAAEQLVNRALEIAPRLAGADAVRNRIAEARRERERERERQERIRAALAGGSDAFDRADFAAARKAAEEALALAPDSVEAQRLLDAADEALAAEEHRRRVRDTIESAQKLFNGRKYDDALALLGAFTPADDSIARTRTELAQQIDAIRQAEDQRRQADADRRRREALDGGIRDVRARLEASMPADALARLAALEADLDAASDLRELRLEAEQAVTRAEEQRRVLEREAAERVRAKAARQREADEQARRAAERERQAQDRSAAPTVIVGRVAEKPVPPATPPVPAVRRVAPAATPAPARTLPVTHRVPPWAIPAAGAVLVAIVGAALMLGPSPPTIEPPPSTSVASGGVTTIVPQPVTTVPTTATSVAPTTTAPATTTVPATSTVAVPPDEARLAALRAASRQQLARRNLQGALNSISEGLRINGTDSELRQILADVRRGARSAASAARRNASAAQTTGAYAAAERSFNEADARARANRDEEATRGFLASADQFARAASEAPQSTIATVTSQPPPPPVTTAPPTSVPAVTTVPPTTSAVAPPPVTTSAALPTTTSAAPPQDPRAAAVAAIERVLDECEAAWASMNARNVAVCGPALANTAQQRLRTGLLQSQSLRIGNRRVELTGDSAQVTCELTYQDVSKRDGALRPTRSQGTFTLRRQGQAWAIEGYRMMR